MGVKAISQVKVGVGVYVGVKVFVKVGVAVGDAFVMVLIALAKLGPEAFDWQDQVVIKANKTMQPKTMVMNIFFMPRLKIKLIDPETRTDRSKNHRPEGSLKS